jgi:hypothetical protein
LIIRDSALFLQAGLEKLKHIKNIENRALSLISELNSEKIKTSYFFVPAEKF